MWIVKSEEMSGNSVFPYGFFLFGEFGYSPWPVEIGSREQLGCAAEHVALNALAVGSSDVADC